MTLWQHKSRKLMVIENSANVQVKGADGEVFNDPLCWALMRVSRLLHNTYA